MKVVQRNIFKIHYKASGKNGEPGIADFNIGVQIIQNKAFQLAGLHIIYKLYSDSQNSELEFEVSDFFVVDLEGERMSADYFYSLVAMTCDDCYRLLMGESSRSRKSFPPKPVIKKVAVMTALNLEIDEYYRVS